MDTYIQTSIKSTQCWHEALTIKLSLDESEGQCVQWKSFNWNWIASNMVLQNYQTADKDIK